MDDVDLGVREESVQVVGALLGRARDELAVGVEEQEPRADRQRQLARAAGGRGGALARRAARQAELNMAAGRPAGGAGLLGREGLLRALLALPTSDLLARVYSMRWS